MNKIHITFFSILLLFILADSINLSAAPVVVLEEGNGYYPIGLNLEYLEDKEKKWPINDITSQELSIRFQDSTQKTLNFKYSASNIWVRFTLKNPSNTERRGLLEHSHPFMNKVNFFLVDLNSVIISKKSGILAERNERDVFDRNHIFSLVLQPNSEITTYLCFSNTGRMYIPLTIWDTLDFIKKIQVNS